MSLVTEWKKADPIGYAAALKEARVKREGFLTANGMVYCTCCQCSAATREEITHNCRHAVHYFKQRKKAAARSVEYVYVSKRQYDKVKGQLSYLKRLLWSTQHPDSTNSRNIPPDAREGMS